MCGRVIVDYDEIMSVAPDTALADWITERPDDAPSSWNLAPTGQLAVAYTDPRDGARTFATAYWSLIPTWSKTLKLKYSTFNARTEDIMQKATFKGSVAKRRCVIPVSGFYEWTGPRGARTPHAIFGPEKILPLAGLLSWWKDPEADANDPQAGWRLTTTILTRESAGVMAPIHSRMPVFMSTEMLDDWLDPAVTGDQLLVDAVSEASLPLSAQLHEYAVAPLRGDGPDLIRPAEA